MYNVIKMGKYLLFLICLCKTINTQIVISDEKPADVLSLKSSVKKAIDHVFIPDETLFFLFSGNDNEYLPENIRNSVVMLNTEEPLIMTNPPTYIRNAVIQLQEYSSLLQILENITNTTVWNAGKSSKGKFIIIVPNIGIRMMYTTFWMYEIVNVVIIGYGGSIQLYTANPFSPGNVCGWVATNISKYSCDEIHLIKFENRFDSLNGCTVYYLDFNPVDSITQIGAGLHLVFHTLQHKLNATVQHYRLDIAMQQNGMYLNRPPLHILLSKLLLMGNVMRSTEHEHIGAIRWFRIIWIVPPTPQIPAMKILGLAFKTEVWIYVGMTWVTMMVTWWLIHRYNNRNGNWVQQLASSFTEVTSMLFCGCVNRAPKTSVLCCLLLLFIWYCIHIQTAFTSKIVNLLTVPQYEATIKSSEELSNSELCILVSSNSTNNTMFEYDDPHNSVCSRLKKKLTVVSDVSGLKMLQYMFTYRNCVVIGIDDMEHIADIYYKQKIHKITDDTVFSMIPYGLHTKRESSLVYPLRDIVSRLTESGILQKVTNAVNEHTKRIHNIMFLDLDDPIPINLEHVCSVFAIYAIGCVISFIVFIIEVLIGYKCRNN